MRDSVRWRKQARIVLMQGRKVENPAQKGVYVKNGRKVIIK